MAGFLVALILVGSSLHTAVSSEKSQEDSEVKYEGPVVYTNLPPPVLYFPNFPEKDKISNRGSSGDTEDKRIEYVPFPYKDLPLLVYKSDKQPPVHVVDKHSNKDADNPNPKLTATGNYQSAQSVYTSTTNSQYGNEPAESHPIPAISGPSGMAASQMPAASSPSPQFISIGVSSIKQQEQLQPASGPQQQVFYNSLQYSGSQDDDQGQYEHDDSQSGQTFAYYGNQQYSQASPQMQQQSYQLPEGFQNYVIQQNQDQQHAQSMQQNLGSYGNVQMDSESAPMQHVGITIIRPGVSDASDGSDHSQGGQQYQQQVVQMAPPQGQGEMSYGGNQQYVTIGVYPTPDAPDTPDSYQQDSPPYYTEMVQGPNNQYQTEEYKQPAPMPTMTQSHGSENQGVQFISIDLSSLRNQQGQQQNSYAEPSQPVYHTATPMQRPSQPPQEMYAAKNHPQEMYAVKNHPQEMYAVKNQNSQSHSGGDKGIQQIVIQLPQNTAPEKPYPQSSQNIPYRGTAQVSNVVEQPGKPTQSSPPYRRPIYNRPPAQSSVPQFGFPPAGINIAIIKQSDTNNKPQYRQPERMPHASQSNRMPTYNNRHPGHRYPPPQSFRGHPRPPFNSQRYNRGHDRDISASTHHQSNTRHPPTNFRQQRGRPMPPPPHQHQRRPEFHQSSNVHPSGNPGNAKPPPLRGPPPRHPPYGHMSASVNHPRFAPMAGQAPFNLDFSESALQAITNNVTGDIDAVNFDYINAFLDPSYDFYGAGQDSKKEEENKIIQKLTNEMMIQELNVATSHLAAGMQPMMGVLPPYAMVQPHPGAPHGPFPYRYWEQNVSPHALRGGIFSQYSHFQHPHGGRPLGRFRKGRRKHKLGNGVRGLKGRLASLRTTIRQKKIAPRQETTDESEMQEINKESAVMTAAPRSTIVQRDGSGLDGIPIPLKVLSSRISTDESEEKPDTMPPIIVYEGTQPPHEVYGTKEDIESKNETLKDGHEPKQIMDLAADESGLSFSADSSGYFNYMYSMLPDLIRDTLGRRQDGGAERWAPVAPLQYALAEDSYDRNDTTSPQAISPIELETVPVLQNTSAGKEASIEAMIAEAMIAEAISLLTKEESSDIV